MRVLRNTHAPENHRPLSARIAPCDLADHLGRNAADGCHYLGCCAGGALLQLAKTLRVIAHIGGVIQRFTDDHIDHRIQQRNIATWREIERMGCIPVKMLATRVKNIEPRAALCGVFDEGCGDRVIDRRVGPDDDDRLRIAAFGKGRRDRARSDILQQCRHR